MFFLFVPYRAKNPTVHFPWITVALIVVNVVVYALTTERFLIIQDWALENYAISHAHFNPLRLLTHMFLHANLSHLIGNMLFLWVFGGAVEGRIGNLFFLPFYLLAGMAGGVAHDVMSGVLNPEIWAVGASGAIMSLLGAYLWLSPYARINVFFCVGVGLRWRAGITTWEARWLVLGFAIVDLVQGFLFRDSGGGGTANFAHLGGLLAGFLLARFSGLEPESAKFAETQALRSDLGNQNLTLLSIYELEPIVNGPQPTPEAVLAYCRRALDAPGGEHKAVEILTRHQDLILEKGSPEQFGELLLDLPAGPPRAPSTLFFQVADRLEKNSWYEMAIRLYRRVTTGNESAPEAEVAMLRLANLLEKLKPNKNLASAVYAEMLRLFPTGQYSPLARQGVARLGPSTLTYSARNGAHEANANLPVEKPAAGASEAASSGPRGLPSISGATTKTVPGRPIPPAVAASLSGLAGPPRTSPLPTEPPPPLEPSPVPVVTPEEPVAVEQTPKPRTTGEVMIMPTGGKPDNRKNR